MKKHPLVRVCWLVVNALLAVSLGAVLYCATWEFSTESYLRGFSDAMIPSTDNPEQKVEAILAWMAHGPARRSSENTNAFDQRNPEETLNIQQLLEVCGTATNAFVNLAQSSGLQARRLLLLDADRSSKHVVAEVLVANRWVIVDPSYRSMLRLPNGSLVTRQELQNPDIFRAATQAIPDYPPSYSYESTVHVRLGRVPVIGRSLRRTFNFIWPSWEETINWTLLLERESFAMLTASMLLLCFALATRLLLGWYCSHRLGIPRVRLRDQIVRAGHVLVGNSE
jgi:Transglutaminase-like superfamily